MEICSDHELAHKESKYCPICSYAKENELLKDNIKLLNEKILKLTTPKDG